MKYAICGTMDQTIGYWAGEDLGWTTKHPDVFLFDDRAPAEVELTSQKETPEDGSAWIEEVHDEAAFRARPDTW